MPERPVYLISPADCTGRRAAMLIEGRGGRQIAASLRSARGAAIGDVFTFVSGLYFRGKLAYASAFATASGTCRGVYVIVPGRGLEAPDARIGLADLREIAAVSVDPSVDRFARPFLEDARALARRLREQDGIVLLGSVATDKYIAVLREAVGDRLYAPKALIGRGSLSRGALLLKAAASGTRLTYVPVERGSQPVP